MLGQNANMTVECLAEYQAEKMALKLKESACVTSESQQLGIMTQQQTTLSPMNMTEIMKYKMDKNIAENYAPIKMYKKCVKTCQKTAGGMSMKGKKHTKQPKNLDFQLCYEQAFKKPYFHVKGSKAASKYCSMKLKNEKYASAAKLSDCMKNALGVHGKSHGSTPFDLGHFEIFGVGRFGDSHFRARKNLAGAEMNDAGMAAPEPSILCAT
uniref:Uncharacterized protein n=1 Tax=Romanomermis culicivorax TaxID=13658 RepID=A0A915KNI0_ROMCU